MTTAKEKNIASNAAVASVEAAIGTHKPNQPEYGSDAVVELLNGFGFDYAFPQSGLELSRAS